MAGKRSQLPQTYRQILEIDMDTSPVRVDNFLRWLAEGIPYVELEGDEKDVWIRWRKVSCRLESIHFTPDLKLNVIDVYASVVPACGRRADHLANWHETLAFKVVHDAGGTIIKLVLVPKSEE